jgi:carboxymethylenebutenolidase
MGDMIQFKRPDGQMAAGYLAMPARASGGEKAPGLVVIQEWWGVNDQIKGVADRYAKAGYRALVPDLYKGKLATTQAEAQALMGALDWGAAATQDVRGAVQHLKSGGGKVGVTGFCMGGAVTILAAVHVPEVASAVCFYGIPPASAADPAKIKVPFQGHFAIHDDWCNPQTVGGLEQSLVAGKVSFELYRYDAKHAFFNEKRPDVYDAACTAQAWDRVLGFLKRTLG